MVRASAATWPPTSASIGTSGDDEVDVARLDHRLDHPGQAHPGAVLGREDPLHAVAVQRLDLARDDHAASAAEDLDVPDALVAQPVHEVLEVLDVAALVAAQRDALDVLGDRGGDDLVDRAVVAQVDDLGALGLQDAAHDVDGRVVAVEQARRGDEAHRVAHGWFRMMILPVLAPVNIALSASTDDSSPSKKCAW